MALSAGVYRRLLADRRIRRLVLGLVVSGANTANALAILLVVTAERGVSEAGLVVAAFAVALAASSPLRGRLIDRRGQGPVLLALAIPHAAFMVALALAAQAGSALFGLVALAALSGLTPAPMGSSMRSLWVRMVGDEDEALLEAAYSFHSVINELLYIFGPLLVGATAALTDPVVALIVVALTTLLGTTIFATSPVSRSQRGTASGEGSWLGPVASAGMRTLMWANFGLGALFGSLEVAVVAFAAERGTEAGAGIALAALAVGSMIGGLAYGAHLWGSPPERRLLILSGLLTLAVAPLPLSSSVLSLSLLMALGGLAVAPLVATEFRMIDFLTPRGTETEANTWIITSYTIGLAGGSVLAGYVADGDGARTALALAAGFGAIAFALTAARFRTLSTGREMVG